MSSQLEQVNNVSERQLKGFVTEASDDDLEALFGEEASSVRLYAEVEAERGQKGDSLIVLLPGLMGSVLADQGSDGGVIWVNPLAFAKGRLNRLDLAPDGKQDAVAGARIAAPNPLWLAYAKIVLRLQHEYAVCSFPYDWRRSVTDTAGELKTFIDRELAESKHRQVTLVGHSLGGLVMIDYLTGDATKAHAESKVKRAIALGAPFRGAIDAVSALANRPNEQMQLARKLNKANDPVRMVRSFPSMYEILPAPKGLYPGWDPLPDADIWNPQTWLDAGHAINIDHLKAAEAHHRRIAAADPQVEFFNVVGTHYDTPVAISGSDLGTPPKKVKAGPQGGDGTVEVASAIFRNRPAYYVHETHVELVLERTVIEGIMAWVEGGKPSELADDIGKVVLGDTPLRAAGVERTANPDEIARKVEAGERLSNAEIKALYTVL